MPNVYLSVTVTQGAKSLRNGRLLCVPSESTLWNVFGTALAGESGSEWPREIPAQCDVAVQTAKESDGPRWDAKSSDDVQRHHAFERKFVFFTIAEAAASGALSAEQGTTTTSAVEEGTSAQRCSFGSCASADSGCSNEENREVQTLPKDKQTPSDQNSVPEEENESKSARSISHASGDSGCSKTEKRDSWKTFDYFPYLNVNPWTSKTFLEKRTSLIVDLDVETVRLLARDYCDLTEMDVCQLKGLTSRIEHNDKLFDFLRVGQLRSFVAFCVMLRNIKGFQDRAKELEQLIPAAVHGELP